MPVLPSTPTRTGSDRSDSPTSRVRRGTRHQGCPAEAAASVVRLRLCHRGAGGRRCSGHDPFRTQSGRPEADPRTRRPPIESRRAAHGRQGSNRAVQRHSPSDPMATSTWPTTFATRSSNDDADGTFRVVAGNGAVGFSGDGGPATKAELDDPASITFGPGGTLYIADYGNGRIRAVSPAGIISTVAGGGQGEWVIDGTPALDAGLLPSALTFGPDGLMYVASGNEILRLGTDGTFTRVVGNPNSDRRRVSTGSGVRRSTPQPMVRTDWPSTRQGISISPDRTRRRFSW